MEEEQKEIDRQIRSREFWAQFGNFEPPKIDPHFLMEYQEYLQTDLWKKIRRRVLKRDKKLCQICAKKATAIHHLSYDYEVIIGERDEDLVSLCKSCHKKIELDESGKKRTDITEKLEIFNHLKQQG